MRLSKILSYSVCCVVGLLGTSDIKAQQTEVEYRGFQLAPQSENDAGYDALRNDHNVNVVRFFISSEQLSQVHSNKNSYFAAVEVELEKIDEKLPLVQANGMQAILAFAYPPNGFESGANPPKSRMFSDAELQDWYIEMIERLVTRYEDEIAAGLIRAIDPLTEPADAFGNATNGAKDWYDLIPDVVAAVRAIDSNVPLVIKAAYGTFDRLRELPCLNQFSNVIPGAHAYLALAYQHNGEVASGYPGAFVSARPGTAQMFNKLITPAARFLKNQVQQCSADVEDLKIDVGEFTAPACATDNHLFADDLIALLERDDISGVSGLATKAECRATKASSIQACQSLTGKAKKKCVKKAKRKFRRCIERASSGGGGNGGSSLLEQFEEQVRFIGWTMHALRLNDNFDPRFTCSGSGAGTLTEVGQTPLYDVLDEYFSRNTF